MRKINFLAVLVTFSLVFSSCSTEENISLESPNTQLLKSFVVKKDAQGKYYLDYNVNGDTKVDKVFDEKTKTNKLFLYSSDTKTDTRLTEEFGLTDSKLKIGFVDTNADKSPSITITDDNIALAKGNADELTSYAVSGNEDGTYQLDFTVTNNVKVDFVYNSSLDAYEIHLDEGKNNGTEFSRTFEREEGKSLKIDFVNHFNANSAKSEFYEAPRKPRVIIDDGND